MSVFSRLRFYHASLALLAVAAYLTEDLRGLHVWIGYALAGTIGLRLLTSLLFPRFLTPPHWLIGPRDFQFTKGLRSPVVGKSILAAIMACLVFVIATGVTLDQRWLAPAPADTASSAVAQSGEKGKKPKKSGPERALKEVHEVAANGLFLIVALHVGYLLLLRRPYALSMMFLGGLASSRRN